ncbi:MHYT domain-containing protein [Rhodococcus marinonascens]|uniref:MHYT domain-containing protein n=1 Tax=Rhodococcus marinonascens TaxID=38311 RepID=UPI0009345977|nr:MHYT domain-containing protein [Rhodococcus marinonascens]
MSDGLQQFSMGTWIIALASITAFVGIFVGVASARKATTTPIPRQRMLWLAWGALSIGGIGAWLPHYIAMVGFDVYGSMVRYDVLWIVISFVVPVAATSIALLIVSPPPTKHRRSSASVEIGRLAAGAALLGVGFIGMQLAIVYSVEIQGSVDSNPVLIAAAAVIGFLVGAGIIWSISSLDSRTLRLVAAVAVAVAVVAMHYTGVWGLTATVDPTTARPDGLEVFSILFPVFVLGMLLVTVPITALLMAPDRVAAEFELEADMLAAESLAAESPTGESRV